jgi:hypothetical protein
MEEATAVPTREANSSPTDQPLAKSQKIEDVDDTGGTKNALLTYLVISNFN